MIKRIGLYLSVAVAAVILGVSFGRIYVRSRKPALAAAKPASREEYLLDNIRGIQVGRPFPDIKLRRPDGSVGVQIRDVLPQGGLIVYTSGDCPACIETVRALGEVIRSSANGLPAVVVAGGNPARIVDFVREKGINVTVAWDSQGTLYKDFGIVTYPSYFLANKELIVESFGTTEGTKDEFALLFEQWKHEGEAR